MDIESELSLIFSQRSSGPFLFLGSGFSRRYIGLEDWEGLLALFCLAEKPYAFYRSSSNKNTPKAARLIADDFHDIWWEKEEFKESRNEYAELISDKTSPLRYEICKYLSQKAKNIIDNPNIDKEIRALKECDVDGIITTNWDQFIENIFPNYKVFTGQKELLFSNTLNIGEIYKIHGCCTNPNSLVLSDEDYLDYNNRNAYLASKLITIFVEHPVVFIGYSIADPNIRDLLKSISLCIGSENIEKLRDNLIFVDRKEPESGAIIETAYLQFDSVQIPVKVVKCSDFSTIYNAIAQFERKLPARVLRFCKERVYELVQGQNPDKKIAVIDYDQVDNIDDIEVVFGIGIIGKLGETGYKGIELSEVFEDLILDNKKFDPKNLLEITISSLPSGIKYVPVFKSLRKLGISNEKTYNDSGIDVDRFIKKNLDEFVVKNGTACDKYSKLSFSDFLGEASELEIFSLTPLFKEIDIEALGTYLRQNYDTLINGKYRYPFRRLMVFYDWKKYGF